MTLHDFDRIQARLASVADPIGFLVNLFAHAPVGFAVWSADGYALLTNNAFMDLFGSEPPPEYNVLQDDVLKRNGMLALFERAFAGETVHVPTFWYDPRELEIVDVKHGRRVAISMTIFPLFKKSGEIDYVAATYKGETEMRATQERLEREQERLQGVVLELERDIAERERLEAERARLESQLLQSQKMEALGTLAGGIAHDFNNLLSVILGHTQLSREELPADHVVQSSLVEIYDASLRASRLVHQILAFGRPQQPLQDIVALGPILEDALRLLRASLPAMIAIRQDVPDSLPPIVADTSQLHQVVANLGTNALHAMAESGGVLELEAAHVHVDGEPADLSPGEYVRLRVSDTGCGIEAELLPRVFEPFFTTKPQGKGSGLGLSVVHGIMKSHHGTVVVQSEVGKGTKFELYFPTAASMPKLLEARADESARGEGRHILLVDDEEALGLLMKRMLERLDYRVTVHTNGEEALRDFRERPKDFHAVVTDYSMPGMSGAMVTEKILEIQPDIPVVMTSGYFRPEDEAAIRKAGASELVLKPNTVEDLSRTLIKAFRRRGV
jgi:signal transduction histidine kinase/ActR/RegA family two-component response regulator